MNRVYQDLQQIRQVCQQLAQTEQQNAQLFAQTPGMQAISEREALAAQQLQQCVQLCNRIEQEIQQNVQSAASVLTGGVTGAFGPFNNQSAQFSGSASFGGQMSQGQGGQGFVNQSVLNQVLQSGSFGGFGR